MQTLERPNSEYQKLPSLKARQEQLETMVGIEVLIVSLLDAVFWAGRVAHSQYRSKTTILSGKLATNNLKLRNSLTNFQLYGQKEEGISGRIRGSNSNQS